MIKNNFRINHICFDLDGTLVKSHITIYKATIEALKDLNIPYENLNEGLFYESIGHHFEDIFEEFNIPVNDFETFISIYRDHYFDFIDESTLYSGVEETISLLKSKNIFISLLTTKGQEHADMIIDHFELRKYFNVVSGRKNGIAHKPAPDQLLLICKEINVNPEESFMVGDTELDIQCGKNAGAKTCGVTYGYRTRKVLEIQEPDLIIDSITELKKLNF